MYYIRIFHLICRMITRSRNYLPLILSAKYTHNSTPKLQINLIVISYNLLTISIKTYHNSKHIILYCFKLYRDLKWKKYLLFSNIFVFNWLTWWYALKRGFVHSAMAPARGFTSSRVCLRRMIWSIIDSFVVSVFCFGIWNWVIYPNGIMANTFQKSDYNMTICNCIIGSHTMWIGKVKYVSACMTVFTK